MATNKKIGSAKPKIIAELKVETTEPLNEDLIEEVTEVEKTPEVAPSVTFEKVINSKPAIQMVRVLMGKDYQGCVGGTRYNLEKGKCYNVPENLKRILSHKAGMLKPL